MKKTIEKYSKLNIVYSDNKDYATITSEDAPGKKVTLFLWDEAQVMRLQEIEKKINAENMEKSRIPYRSIQKKNNKNTTIVVIYIILVLLGLIYLLWKF